MAQLESLDMLQYLDMLLKHGNFTKAAKSLYISQPYLTQSIKKVERELGVTIIDRKATPLALTEPGRLYYQYLSTLEGEQTRFQKKMTQYAEPDRTILRVGVLASLGTYLLPLMLPAFLAAHPKVDVELFEAVPAVNEKRLLNHELDFFIGQNPETLPASLAVNVQGRHGYVAIIPETSKLYQKGAGRLAPGAVPIRALLSERLILTRHGSAIRRQVDYLIAKYKIRPQVVLESDNIFTSVALAKTGLGVTFLPESVATGALDGRFNVCPLPLSLLSLDYFIAYRAHPLTAVGADFVAAFASQVAADIARTCPEAKS
ncbi:LysR family transcriptional regulator [Lacticaseibacillus kribbianus]|uniref:LysR family transcriptional regulator n=1 Tax=Lacticaseibacillus kribbianus TaxID=2926292 RepID=UPI001CD6CE25|nr:LysR family transcriptional regulator [Lacticaseibacillus kribbianus]